MRKSNFSGRSSLEVRVETYVEHIDGSRTLINKAYVVLVALNENEKPTVVPVLVPETDEEIEEFDRGIKRRLLRKQRNIEQY